jgi:rhodanese-related sulfurtransferase
MSAENWPDAVNDYVLQVRKLVNTIGMDDYLEVVKNPRGATIIDVRDEDELKAGMVPAAINISRGRLEFRIWRALGYPNPVDTTRRIYVQCATGGRATLAAKQLKDIGFTNVVAVIVNMADWEKRGYPLAKAALPRN